MADNSNDKPRAVRSHDVMLDKEYVQWMHEIKQRFRSAQIKAAVRINSEQLLFNWQLGRDLVVRKACQRLLILSLFCSPGLSHISSMLLTEFVSPLHL